jgi:hypothetical protein
VRAVGEARCGLFEQIPIAYRHPLDHCVILRLSPVHIALGAVREIGPELIHRRAISVKSLIGELVGFLLREFAGGGLVADQTNGSRGQGDKAE